MLYFVTIVLTLLILLYCFLLHFSQHFYFKFYRLFCLTKRRTLPLTLQSSSNINSFKYSNRSNCRLSIAPSLASSLPPAYEYHCCCRISRAYNQCRWFSCDLMVHSYSFGIQPKNNEFEFFPMSFLLYIMFITVLSLVIFYNYHTLPHVPSIISVEYWAVKSLPSMFAYTTTCMASHLSFTNMQRIIHSKFIYDSSSSGSTMLDIIIFYGICVVLTWESLFHYHRYYTTLYSVRKMEILFFKQVFIKFFLIYFLFFLCLFSLQLFMQYFLFPILILTHLIFNSYCIVKFAHILHKFYDTQFSRFKSFNKLNFGSGPTTKTVAETAAEIADTNAVPMDAENKSLTQSTDDEKDNYADIGIFSAMDDITREMFDAVFQMFKFSFIALLFSIMYISCLSICYTIHITFYIPLLMALNTLMFTFNFALNRTPMQKRFWRWRKLCSKIVLNFRRASANKFSTGVPFDEKTIEFILDEYPKLREQSPVQLKKGICDEFQNDKFIEVNVADVCMTRISHTTSNNNSAKPSIREMSIRLIPDAENSAYDMNPAITICNTAINSLPVKNNADDDDIIYKRPNIASRLGHKSNATVTYSSTVDLDLCILDRKHTNTDTLSNTINASNSNTITPRIPNYHVDVDGSNPPSGHGDGGQFKYPAIAVNEDLPAYENMIKLKLDMANNTMTTMTNSSNVEPSPSSYSSNPILGGISLEIKEDTPDDFDLQIDTSKSITGSIRSFARAITLSTRSKSRKNKVKRNRLQAHNNRRKRAGSVGNIRGDEEDGTTTPMLDSVDTKFKFSQSQKTMIKNSSSFLKPRLNANLSIPLPRKKKADSARDGMRMHSEHMANNYQSSTPKVGNDRKSKKKKRMTGSKALELLGYGVKRRHKQTKYANSARFNSQLSFDTWESEVSLLTTTTAGGISSSYYSPSDKQLYIQQPLSLLTKQNLHMQQLSEYKEYESGTVNEEIKRTDEEEKEQRFGNSLVLPHISVNLRPQLQKMSHSYNSNSKSNSKSISSNKNMRNNNSGKHIQSLSQMPESKHLESPGFRPRSASVNKFFSEKMNCDSKSSPAKKRRNANIYPNNNSPLAELTDVLNKMANQGWCTKQTAKSVAQIHKLCMPHN